MRPDHPGQWRAWLMSERPASRRQAALGRAYATWCTFARNRLAVVGLLIVLGPLVKTLTGLIGIIKTIRAMKLGATIAGWAGAAGPAIVAIKAAFAGMMAFFTGTLGPALLAFFSGPVGWTVLAVAAVVAMAILFRKPLGQFITWLGSVFKKGWDGFVNNILKKPLTDYFKWWKKNWESAVKFVTALFAGIEALKVS
jgi:hypothetical protein